MYNIVFSYNKDKKTYGIAAYNDVDTHVEFIPEANLIGMLQTGVQFSNIGLKDGKLVGLSGALSRFSPKTMVVLSRLCTVNDALVGYRIMSSQGRVFKWKLSSIQTFCESAKAAGFVPFQNAIYVEGSIDVEAHIKSYPDSPFPTVIISAQRREAPPQEEQKPVDLKVLLAEQDSLYTKEQKKQLQMGVEAGLNVAPYAHPEIPYMNMSEIRCAMLRGQPVTPVTNHLFYTANVETSALKYILVVAAEGIDITAMLDPRFNVSQLGEIHLGLVSGLDVTEYAHPEFSAYQMSLMRKEQEGDFWQEFSER